MIIPPNEALDKYVRKYIDSSFQVQQAGIDLSISKIYSFISYGSIDFDNKNRKLADSVEIKLENDEPTHLASGVYRIKTNELIELDNKTIGVFFPRSSLIRNGASVSAGLFDPGYKGYPEFLLTILNPNGLEVYKNARIGQIVFFRSRKKLSEYKGIYKNK